jgi:hypothetical protein
MNEEKRIKEEKLKEYIASIDDQIVKNWGFQALKKWWFSTSTHVLKEDNFWNYLFQINSFIKLFFLLYIISPVIYFVFFFSHTDFLNQILVFENFLFLLVFPAGIIMYFFLFKSYIFDFWNWYFYEKRFQKNLFKYVNDSKYQNKIIPLNNIHALQLLGETVSWGKNNSSYISYELNLILKDSSRINVIDHWDLEQIKEDAKKIAEKLKIKLYDITSFVV